MVQEAEFHTRALETVQGSSPGRSDKFDMRVIKESPRNFLVDQALSQKLGVFRDFVRCAKVTWCWACEEFKKLDIPKRRENVKKFKLCLRCLGRDYLGQQCTCVA